MEFNENTKQMEEAADLEMQYPITAGSIKNPWKKHRGLHKDCPHFAEVVKYIEENRRLEREEAVREAKIENWKEEGF